MNNSTTSLKALAQKVLAQAKPVESDRGEESLLRRSRQRLESLDLSVSIFPDGSTRIVAGREQIEEAARAGAAVYSPEEMWLYVTLSPSERRMVRQLKSLRPGKGKQS